MKPVQTLGFCQKTTRSLENLSVLTTVFIRISAQPRISAHLE